MKKIFSYIIYSFYTIIVIGVLVLFVLPPLPSLGAVEVKIVKSGSMEPNIMTGAVVVVREFEKYGLNDVVTFTNPDSEIPTTHRIIGTEILDGKEYFITKGDANEERDTNLVSNKDIIGKVVLDIPYVGFIFDFARHPIGFLLLIGLPALLIIIDELDNILREIRRSRQSKTGKDAIVPLVIKPDDSIDEKQDIVRSKSSKVVKVKMIEAELIDKTSPQLDLQLKNKKPITTKVSNKKNSSSLAVTTTGLMLVVATAGQATVGYSSSYFSDTEASMENTMEAQSLDFTISPDNESFVILGNSFKGADGLDVSVSNNDLVYDVSTEFMGGSMAFCDSIKVNTDTPLVFSGSLTSLSGNNISFNNPWSLDFDITSGGYIAGDTCLIDVIFSGYSDADVGFVDKEAVQLSFVFDGELLEPVIQSIQVPENINQDVPEITPKEISEPVPTVEDLNIPKTDNNEVSNNQELEENEESVDQNTETQQ